MPYRRRNLNEPQTSTPLEPLRGRQLMRRARASAVHAQGDRVLSHGRRILVSVGLHGAGGWHIPDTAGGEEFREYPTDDDERVVARLPPIRLTPGHFLRAVVIANPSGQTQSDTTGDAEITYPNTGPSGRVRIAATYNNGSDETVTQDLVIPASGAENAAQPSGPGAAWSQLHRVFSPLLLPADMTKIANLAAWSDGVTVELTVSYVGSPRVLDLVVYEEPFALAYDLSSEGWVAPMHAAGDGGNLGALKGPVPVTKRGASDPGGGAEIVCDSAARLCQELGPVLFHATAWDEGSQSVTASETAYRSVSGTTLSSLMDATTTAWSASTAGWSPASGANAPRVQDMALKSQDRVIPVRCYVYGAMSTASGSPTATVRFETADYSMAEIAVPSGTSYAWHEAPGHLRVGLGAQDPGVFQVRGRTSTLFASFRWRYIVVVYDPTI